MDDVGELDGILNEKHRDVVSHKIENTFVGVELGCESASVAHRVGGATRTEHRREAHEDRGLHALGEEPGTGEARRGAVPAEHSVRCSTARMNDALGDSLVIEVRDLLTEMMVLQQGGTTLACLE
ncbi:hypothetical protein EV641_118125 [Rhodococcus sp. SMB37]|nr:hypothetical protein EV641_118125 [Rhodococcus sp. SMB37]